MNDDAITAREAMTVGAGMRITPLEQHELGDEARAIADEIGAVLGLDAPDDLTPYFALMFRHPALYRCQLLTGIQLLGHGLMPPIERELAILRTAWRCGAPYEWAEHVDIARKLGVSPDITLRVTLGPEAAGWTPHESALLRAVDELHDDKMITDATWGVLASSYSDAQMIELPALVGQYAAVAMIQNSLHLPLVAGRKGLRER